MQYHANITIKLKKGMLDPEANAIREALKNLGFEVNELDSARQFRVIYEAESKSDATQQAEKMCQRLLANPVIHQYSIEGLYEL